MPYVRVTHLNIIHTRKAHVQNLLTSEQLLCFLPHPCPVLTWTSGALHFETLGLIPRLVYLARGG